MLDAISQMPQENHAAAKVEHPKRFSRVFSKIEYAGLSIISLCAYDRAYPSSSHRTLLTQLQFDCEKAVTSSMILVADSFVLDDCDLLVCHMRVEHSRLHLAMLFNLYKQTIAAGLRKTVGE